MLLYVDLLLIWLNKFRLWWHDHRLKIYLIRECVWSKRIDVKKHSVIQMQFFDICVYYNSNYKPLIILLTLFSSQHLWISLHPIISSIPSWYINTCLKLKLMPYGINNRVFPKTFIQEFIIIIFPYLKFACNN